MKILKHSQTRGGKYQLKLIQNEDGTLDLREYTNGQQTYASTGYTTMDYAFSKWARYVNDARTYDGRNFRPVGEK